jgi:hypothetical protein
MEWEALKMTVRTDPRYGFKYGWASGDDGWGDDMNTNLELLQWLIQAGVADVDLSTPPGSPNIGDFYIVGPSATGAWAGEEESIAVWWQDGDDASAEWKFLAPDAGMEGLTVWIADENEYAVWTGAAWHKKTEWDKLSARFSVINKTTTSPPGSPTLDDAYIVGGSATGAWAGQDDNIAVWWQEPGAAAAWKFFTAVTGLTAYNEGTNALEVFDTSWSAV